MMMLIKVAWRNLWRNRTRTLISITAISLSYALFLVSIGIAEGQYENMEKAAAESAGGSVLIHGKGYWDSQLNDIVIKDADALVETVRETPGVQAVARRVLVNGLLSTSAGATATRLQGVVPEAEGEFQNPARFVEDGVFLTGDEEAPLVLGRGIVEDLEIELGDRVVLTATGPDGEMRRALFHLTGIIDTGFSSLDDAAAYTTVEGAQKAVGMDGQLTQIGVLAPGETRHQVRDALVDRLHDRYEVLTWDDAMPDLVGMIQLDAAFGDIYGFVVFIVVVFAVMNTFLMIVMERIREFGLLNAIGLTPRQIALLLLLESICLAVVSIVIGFAIGFGLHLYLAEVGIDMAIFATEVEMGGVTLTDTIMRSTIDVGRWLNATLSVFVMVLLASAYPAYKASRLTPAEAMRFFH